MELDVAVVVEGGRVGAAADEADVAARAVDKGLLRALVAVDRHGRSAAAVAGVVLLLPALLAVGGCGEVVRSTGLELPAALNRLRVGALVVDARIDAVLRGAAAAGLPAPAVRDRLPVDSWLAPLLHTF